MDFGVAVPIAVIGLGMSALIFRLVMIWPGRLIPKAERPPSAMAELGLIALGLQLLFMLLAPYLVAALAPGDDSSREAAIPYGLLVTAVGNLGIVLTVFCMGQVRFGLRPGEMGLKRPSFWSLLLAVLLLGAALPAFVGISWLNARLVEALGWETHQALVKTLMSDEGLLANPLVVIAIVLVVPLLEEILFRGFLQSALRVAVGPLPAILAASLLFAIVHDIQSTLPVCVVGLTLGAIYERTGSVWASALAHSVFNGLQVLNIFLLSS